MICKSAALASVVVVILAGAMLGAGTISYFTDTATSTDNTFQAGTWVDLRLSDQDEGFGDGVTATWTALNMNPGDIVGPWNVDLQNWASIAADHVAITCSNIVDDPPGPDSDTEEGTTDMDQAMEITMMTYSGTDLLDLLIDHNGNGIKDLDDFETQGFDDLKPPPPPNKGGTTSFSMTVRFHLTLGDNDYQGDTLTTTITFILI